MPAPKLKKDRKFDVMLTRTVLITEPGGTPTTFGPDKRGGEPVKITVSRRVANQIVGANRGYWPDGKPSDPSPRENIDDDEASGPGSKKKTTRGPSGV